HRRRRLKYPVKLRDYATFPDRWFRLLPAPRPVTAQQEYAARGFARRQFVPAQEHFLDEELAPAVAAYRDDKPHLRRQK
ncbi:hypothetical protein EC881042_1920B, partial [Escherichia coli 88.1042]